MIKRRFPGWPDQVLHPPAGPTQHGVAGSAPPVFVRCPAPSSSGKNTAQINTAREFTLYLRLIGYLFPLNLDTRLLKIDFIR